MTIESLLTQLESLHAASTQGDWLWQKLGGKWHLVAQDKWRHIVLSAGSHNRTPYLTNLVDGLLAQLTPEHPDSALIEAAHNHLPAVIAEVRRLQSAHATVVREYDATAKALHSVMNGEGDYYKASVAGKENTALKAEVERLRAVLKAGVDRYWFDRNKSDSACSTCDCGGAGYPTNPDGHDTDCFVSNAKAALGESK